MKIRELMGFPRLTVSIRWRTYVFQTGGETSTTTTTQTRGLDLGNQLQ
jgi:hypothetical protein